MEQLASVEQGMEDLDKFLIFRVDDETFGVPVLKVQEIIGYRGVTPIPNTPHVLRGVLNLRGVVVPVVDLRRQFAMEDREYDRFNVIVIAHVVGKTIGMIVDAVTDVISVRAEDLESRLDFAARINTDFISSVLNHEEEMLVLLDLDSVLTDEEIGILDRVTDGPYEEDNIQANPDCDGGKS